MELNLINVLYMFFRLSPFIIVSYFTLQSILNQDLKGVIYLVGLIVTSFIVYLIASMLPEEPVSKNSNDLMKVKCTQLTIGSGAYFGFTPQMLWSCTVERECGFVSGPRLKSDERFR